MEILIIGLVRGSLYSLISVGFVLVFSVGGILNLCHGILYMMGAYFTYIFYAYFFNSGGKGNPYFIHDSGRFLCRHSRLIHLPIHI